ncbi:hypothetical protein D3C76_458550 [compost metagenome]
MAAVPSDVCESIIDMGDLGGIDIKDIKIAGISAPRWIIGNDFVGVGRLSGLRLEQAAWEQQ